MNCCSAWPASRRVRRGCQHLYLLGSNLPASFSSPSVGAREFFARLQAADGLGLGGRWVHWWASSVCGDQGAPRLRVFPNTVGLPFAGVDRRFVSVPLGVLPCEGPKSDRRLGWAVCDRAFWRATSCFSSPGLIPRYSRWLFGSSGECKRDFLRLLSADSFPAIRWQRC